MAEIKSDNEYKIIKPQTITFKKGGYKDVQKTFLPIKHLYEIFETNNYYNYYEVKPEPYYCVVSIKENLSTIKDSNNESHSNFEIFGHKKDDTNIYFRDGNHTSDTVETLNGSLGTDISSKTNTPDIMYSNSNYSIDTIDNMHVSSTAETSGIFYSGNNKGAFDVSINKSSFSYRNYLYIDSENKLHTIWNPNNSSSNVTSCTFALSIPSGNEKNASDAVNGWRGDWGNDSLSTIQDIKGLNSFYYQYKCIGNYDLGNRWNDGYEFTVKISSSNSNMHLVGSKDYFKASFKQNNGWFDKDNFTLCSWSASATARAGSYEFNTIKYTDGYYLYSFVTSSDSNDYTLSKSSEIITHYNPIITLTVSKVLGLYKNNDIVTISIPEATNCSEDVSINIVSSSTFSLIENASLSVTS